jgi:hypothetical protein
MRQAPPICPQVGMMPHSKALSFFPLARQTEEFHECSEFYKRCSAERKEIWGGEVVLHRRFHLVLLSFISYSHV